MKILAVSADSAGCLHYRLRLPFTQLRRNGHDVAISDTYAVRRSGEIGARYQGEDLYGFDLVVFQRVMHTDTAAKLARARSTGQVITNDVDDWYFGLPQSNAAFRATHNKINLEHNIDNYRKVLSGSDAVTVSTPYLAQRLRSVNENVYVLPNFIDTACYEVKVTRNTTDPDLGWVGSLHHRDTGDMAQIRGALPAFFDEHLFSGFVHVGSDDFGERIARQTGIPWARVFPHPRCHIDDLPKELLRFDVALAPLADTPFNMSKSYIKALEAATAGVPCIASDMPEYRKLGTAVLCSRPKDWRQALERLSDPQERASLAQLARSRAEQFDIRHHWKRWEKTYAELIGTREEATA
jgi:glycosyltransferase involved in cell wall biosynthesis